MRIKAPNFDGTALVWVAFIIKFKDILYEQNYVTSNQKLHYLQQQATREAQVIQGFANNRIGYVLSLKLLKYLFEQKSRVAQVHLSRINRGKLITSSDDQGLAEYY